MINKERSDNIDRITQSYRGWEPMAANFW